MFCGSCGISDVTYPTGTQIEVKLRFLQLKDCKFEEIRFFTNKEK